MSSDVAIKVDNVSKCYQIYDTPRARLKQFVMPRLRHSFGLPLHTYFREFWALRDVSFEVKKGETVGIIGRNGSGKSTLLQMICGTLNPTSGRIQAHGRIAALLELGSGFNPEFTGRENVYMNAAILGVSKDEIDARFDDIAAFADIGHFIDQPVKSYSSGMVVRLAFAVQAMINPDILVVDEALAVGDERFQRKCFARLEELKANGTSVLFVSHSASSIVELCDRALLIDKGDLIATGVPKPVVGAYQKLLYAPDHLRDAIREEIIAGELIREQKSDLAEDDASIIDGVAQGDHDEEPEESFDPHLIPTSTICYASKGAVVHSVEILSLAGERINALRRGGRYRYRYRVDFKLSASHVRFGMLIKTLSGTEIAGSHTANRVSQGIEHVAAGARLLVEFEFDCRLNAGIYFANAGVTGNVAGMDDQLHRILDAAMFRVVPDPTNLATSVVDLNIVPRIETA